MVLDAIEQVAGAGGAEAEHEGVVGVLVAFVGLGETALRPVFEVVHADPLAPLLDCQDALFSAASFSRRTV